METTHEQADPVAKGVIATAKQSWHDLFTFKQRIVVATGPHGEALATEWARPAPLQNPIRQLATLTPRAWLFFLVGLAAWTADAFDFHALAIQQVVLAEYYSTTKTKLSTAITLTLLLRSVGAAGFGLAGDRFGRKWPMVINMWVLGLLQIATIYSQTLGQFLAVRSLSGLFMGGVYGNAFRPTPAASSQEFCSKVTHWGTSSRQRPFWESTGTAVDLMAGRQSSGSLLVCRWV
jgi:hypothetical protein